MRLATAVLKAQGANLKSRKLELVDRVRQKYQSWTVRKEPRKLPYHGRAELESNHEERQQIKSRWLSFAHSKQSSGRIWRSTERVWNALGHASGTGRETVRSARTNSGVRVADHLRRLSSLDRNLASREFLRYRLPREFKRSAGQEQDPAPNRPWSRGEWGLLAQQCLENENCICKQGLGRHSSGEMGVGRSTGQICTRRIPDPRMTRRLCLQHLFAATVEGLCAQCRVSIERRYRC